MSVKLALLKSGEVLISDIKELVDENKVVGYLFNKPKKVDMSTPCLLYTSPSPRDRTRSRMPSSA